MLMAVYQGKHKNYNCFMSDEMVDFTKLGHKCKNLVKSNTCLGALQLYVL